ncbi:MAG: hypothetical protein LLF94_08780 [Chlamydiales bacterium]|nr:hypothetical protein [Chlamydiales bacterium]
MQASHTLRHSPFRYNQNLLPLVNPSITGGMQAYYEAENRQFESDITNPKQLHLLRQQIEKNRGAIREGARGLEGTLVIAGMGRGVFLPLEALCEQFDRVVAIDIDLSSMDRAVHMLPEMLREKIVLVSQDVTGAVATFSTTVERYLSTCKTADEFVQKLLQKTMQFTPIALDLSQYQATYAISSMTMTHLLDTPFRYLLDRFCQTYSEKPETLCNNHDLMCAVSELNTRIQLSHLEQMDNAVKKPGRVFISLPVATSPTTYDNNQLIEVRPPVMVVQPEVHEKLRANSFSWIWEKSLPHHNQLPDSITLGTRLIVQAQIRT